MAERKVKCPICNQLDFRSIMVQVDNMRYYHINDCHQQYIEQQEYQKQENKKWSDLYEYIKELHGLIVLPPWNVTRLKNLRKGIDTKEKKEFQRYRIGVEFDLMLEAYKLQEDKIKWFIKDVLNDGKDASDINKCISMMLNGLNTAWKNRQIKIKQEQEIAKALSETIAKDMSIEEPIKQKRKNDSRDISHLL